MKKRNQWLGKLFALSLCVAMAAEPMTVCAEDFMDSPAAVQSASDFEEGTDETVTVADQPDAVVDTESEPEETQQWHGEKGEDLDIETKDPDVTIEEEPEEDAEEANVETEDEENADAEEADFSCGDVGNSDDVLSGTCGENVTWELKDGIMTIAGNGAMDGFWVVKDWWTGEIIEEHRCPWEAYNDQIREVYVQDGVTSIGTTAFADCAYLQKVIIGNSVKTIGWGAFVNDRELTDLTLGNSLETIGDNAFSGIGVTKLVLPSSIKSLTRLSLLGMSELESIEISGNATYKSIDGVLYSDNGKTLFCYPSKRSGEYMIPSGITKIAEDAFCYTSLTKIVISDSVTEIGEGAFSHAENLTTLVFGKGAKTIPRTCCFYDRALTSVTIPEGVTTIKELAFQSCPALMEITLPSSVTTIEKAFESNTKVTIKNENIKQLEDGSYIDGLYVNVTAKEMYKKAFEVLDLVNKERAKQGLSALVMDKSLLETAMMRGFETALYWNHTRPNGASCFTANSSMMGENIAAYAGDAKSVMNLWMNSDGHRANILGGYKSIGIGCVSVNGAYYWVQCFSTEGGTAVTASSYKDENKSRNVLVKKSVPYYSADLRLSSDSIYVGEKASAYVIWNYSRMDKSGAVFESSDPSVCEVNRETGTLTAKKAGTAYITMYYPGYKDGAVKKKVTVKAKNNSSSNNSGSTAKVSSCRVNYYPNGGQGSTVAKKIKKNAKLGTLPKIKRNGYTFDGWYTAKTKGTKVSVNTKVTKNLNLYAHWSKVKVARASVKKLTNVKGRKAVVTLNKISGARGYQIVYANNAKFKGAKGITTSKTSVTLNNLQKNKTYYVKVRAYKLDSSGRKVFGSYSMVKKIKIKQ